MPCAQFTEHASQYIAWLVAHDSWLDYASQTPDVANEAVEGCISPGFMGILIRPLYNLLCSLPL
jgi:hypothetical protein